MKKIFQTIGLLALICFSFIYTDKAITVLKENDPLMIEIQSNTDKYQQKFINATIDDDTIIPGIYGREINLNKSYNNMKKTGLFNEKLLIYDNIKPEISINDNYDKYIINGNKTNNKVALLFIIEDNKYINQLLKITESYNTNINLFINTNYLNENISSLYKISKNNQIFNYGSNGIYKKELLILGNNIINRNTNNLSNYCLAKEKKLDTIRICSENKMYTILPSIIINDNPYNEITNKIEKGNIVLFELNKYTLNEISIIINFINKKGLSIVKLSELLSEKN